MFLWFRKYTSWYDIVDWGKFGQLIRDFCNFWTRELHLNSYYGGWPGDLKTTFGCPAETVDQDQRGNVRNLKKTLLFLGFLEISGVNSDTLDSQVDTLLSFLDYLFNFRRPV